MIKRFAKIGLLLVAFLIVTGASAYLTLTFIIKGEDAQNRDDQPFRTRSQKGEATGQEPRQVVEDRRALDRRRAAVEHQDGHGPSARLENGVVLVLLQRADRLLERVAPEEL